MEIGRLENRWVELFGSTHDIAVVKETFKTLTSRYSEKHRYYHTLSHINACLNLLDEVTNFIVEPFNVEVAIWFHDVIYNPKRNNNEEMSAKYAKAFLESVKLDSVDIRNIERLILLTKHPSSPETNDEKYLMDIDLSILGADDDLYDSYESWIRKEYASVPYFLYKRGRKKALNSFVESGNIYKTDYFHEKYEIQARKNIDRALLEL